MLLEYWFILFSQVLDISSTIRHAGVIGLWASPVTGKKPGGKLGPPVMRQSGFGKLGGFLNTAVAATKKTTPGETHNLIYPHET